ncbi:hypothetical protein [Streptomyces sp. NPDC057686]|uniref:hypothetical protein n=1 Tax=Streptomyces sp. NPDC057686 TaxID=3346212 RepID=UPI003697654C
MRAPTRRTVQRRDRRDGLLDPYPGDAVSATWTLECTATPTEAGFDLTDACGRPLCAQVRPPLVEWSAPARWPDPTA